MSEWLDAEAHAERAQRFYEAGQWRLALKALERALACDPAHSDWHFGMGLALEAMQRHADAVEAFERALELRGDNVETMLSLASNLTRSGKPADALDVLERVNELEPECEPGYCLRIEAYARLGDHDLAEQMFYRARQIVDECPACYDHIAQSLAMRGDWHRAIWCWNQTARLDPSYLGVHANMARLQWRRGRHLHAQRLYVRQLRQTPDDIPTLLEWGRLLIDMRWYQQALTKFRRVLEIDTEIAEAHLCVGELVWRSGRIDKAHVAYSTAVRLDATLPGVDLGLARIAQQQSQKGMALTLVRRELTRKGHRPDQFIEIARLFIALHQPNRAVAIMTQLIDCRSELPCGREHLVNALLCRASAQLSSDQSALATADYAKAVRIAPSCAEGLRGLVHVHLHCGRLRAAAYWLQRARRVLPGDRQLRRMRNRLALARFQVVVRRLTAPLRSPRRDRPTLVNRC